jgi:hypothetical protein
MKKLLLVLTLALCAPMTFAQNIPSYVPTNGLVGYWPFNGNANDMSGNNLNGNVIGATITNDRFGNPSSAYNFDFNNVSFGLQNQEIYVPFSPILNVNNITISLWVYQREYYWTGNSNPPFSTLIARFQFGYSTPNGEAWMINSWPSKIGAFATSSTPITLNQWTHIVSSYDGNVGKTYINGVLVGSINNTNGININGNSGISIGESNQANGFWWPTNGIIDDIGIWNRALTQEEITNLYYAENSCQSLVINTGVLSFNPPTYNNTVTIYPNPANDHITIDCGNLANVSGWSIKIFNTLGQEVFSGAMNTQQYVVPLNTWSGQGVYFVKIYDASNQLMNTKKIILQ